MTSKIKAYRYLSLAITAMTACASEDDTDDVFLDSQDALVSYAERAPKVEVRPIVLKGEIVDLRAFQTSALRELRGLTIDQTSLRDLTGLENITRVDQLFITQNDSLTTAKLSIKSASEYLDIDGLVLTSVELLEVASAGRISIVGSCVVELPQSIDLSDECSIKTGTCEQAEITAPPACFVSEL